MNYISAPALKSDATRPPSKTEHTARVTVANLIHNLQHKGFHPFKVFDGEEFEMVNNLVEAMEVIFSVELAQLYVKKEGGKSNVIVLIPSNGEDVISDHTSREGDPDGFVKIMDDFCEDFDHDSIIPKTPNQEIAMGDIKAMTPVNSSTIAAVAHDNIGQIMKVQFKNGSVYQYQNVDADLYNSIVTAESVGKAFDAKIKKQAVAHPFTKVA